MKKIFLYSVTMLTCFSAFTKCYSQTLKIGVFDIDAMVHTLPEYKCVDSLIDIYESENPTEMYYDAAYSELEKTDEYFSYCKSAPYDKKFMDSISLLRQQIIVSIIYGKEILEREREQRKRRFSEPLYQKVRTAFKKVVKENKYDLVLKPGAIYFGNNVDNLFVLVAKELNITLLPTHLLYLNFSNKTNAQ